LAIFFNKSTVYGRVFIESVLSGDWKGARSSMRYVHFQIHATDINLALPSLVDNFHTLYRKLHNF